MTLLCVDTGLAQTAPQALTISGDFIGRPFAPGDPLEFTLSRVMLPGEGTLAVMIGQMDVTSLLTATTTGFRYLPSPVALPLGVSDVVVYRITPGDVWQEINRFSLEVSAGDTLTQARPPPQVENAVPQIPSSGPAVNPARTTFLSKPSLTVGLTKNAAETRFPDTGQPRQPSAANYTLQGNLQNSWQGPGVSFRNQFDIAGTSVQNQALRFALRGEDAPKVDLSNYSMAFNVGRGTLQAGQMPFGTHRQLINAFSSRGVSLTVPVRGSVSVTVGALNGSNIVGWDNFFGLSTQDHRMVFGTLGVELIRARPGGLRFEATLMDGSVLPIQGFNQGVVNDAEKSHGTGVRLVASDRGQRVRVDGGYSRSRFHNPSDPLLEQGQNVVPVLEDTAAARYLDATWNIVQNKAVTKTKNVSLSATYRHERVAPLYRSLGAAIQADRLQNQWDVTSTVGPINVLLTHMRDRNNLLELPGLLTVDTRRNAVMLAIPTASVFAKDPSKPSQWLPTISYNLDQTHQAGRGFPTGFLDLTQVPDQLSTNQNASVDWQLGRYRAAYRVNRSFQDNRQVGRELADLSNLVNGVSLGGTVLTNLDLGYEQSIESARNVEQDRVDRLFRSGVSLNWRMTTASMLTAMVSATMAGDVQQTNERRNAEVDCQWTYRLVYDKGSTRKVQSQLLVRYANRYASTVDNLFGVRGLTKIQTFNVGLNVTFF